MFPSVSAVADVGVADVGVATSGLATGAPSATSVAGEAGTSSACTSGANNWAEVPATNTTLHKCFPILRKTYFCFIC